MSLGCCISVGPTLITTDLASIPSALREEIGPALSATVFLGVEFEGAAILPLGTSPVPVVFFHQFSQRGVSLGEAVVDLQCGSGDDLITPNGKQGIAVDPEGNAYVIGVTDSIDFPVTAGAFQKKFAGGGSCGVFGTAGDAFVTKLNKRGDAFVYSTYLGGTTGDCGEGIAVDPAGNAYVVGRPFRPTSPSRRGLFKPLARPAPTARRILSPPSLAVTVQP